MEMRDALGKKTERYMAEFMQTAKVRISRYLRI